MTNYLTNIISPLNVLRSIIFFEYAIWGSYLTTIYLYVTKVLSFSNSDVAFMFALFCISSLLAILPFNIIADKLISAKYVYIFCLAIIACCLCALIFITDKYWFFIMFGINAFFYMPSISLSQTIQIYTLRKYNLPLEANLALFRIYSTVGFIIGLWVTSILNYEESSLQFMNASVAACICVLSAFFCEKVKIFKDKSNKIKILEFINVSIKTFCSKNFILLLLVSLCLGCITQINNTYGNAYVKDIGYTYYSFIYSIGFLSAIFVKYFYSELYKRFTLNNIINISIVSWFIRCFLLIVFYNNFPLIIMAMMLYSLCFDVFLITAMIIVDNGISQKMRATGQAILLFVFNGLGALSGTYLVSILPLKYEMNQGKLDFAVIWGCCCLIAFIAFVINFFMKEK